MMSRLWPPFRANGCAAINDLRPACSMLPAAALLAAALVQGQPLHAAPFDSSDLPGSVLVEEQGGGTIIAPAEAPIPSGRIDGSETVVSDALLVDDVPQADGRTIDSPIDGDGGEPLGDVPPGEEVPLASDATGKVFGFSMPNLSLPQFGSASAPAACTDGTCGTCRNCCRTTMVDCDPPGLLQKLCNLHDKSNACWSGRVDALILWRDAPPNRPLVETGDNVPRQLLNANSMQSTAAAGPRISLFRGNPCTGDAWEMTYLRAANFRSQRYLPETADRQYALSPPGIYGNANSQNFDSGYANLGSSLQSFEFNHHLCHGKHIRWLAGFRWVEWQEQFTLQDNFNGPPEPFTDFYQTGCVNDLYGGQIGADLYLLSLPWIRFDSVIKAGAYYNTAVQNSLYATSEPGVPTPSQSSHVAQTPASCAFVGELGFTGVVPVTKNLDIRVGYFGLWLSGIAQPTQQLSGQRLDLNNPPTGSLTTRGGTLAQGVSLGLEGRW